MAYLLQRRLKLWQRQTVGIEAAAAALLLTLLEAEAELILGRHLYLRAALRAHRPVEARRRRLHSLHELGGRHVGLGRAHHQMTSSGLAGLGKIGGDDALAQRTPHGRAARGRAVFVVR